MAPEIWFLLFNLFGFSGRLMWGSGVIDAGSAGHGEYEDASSDSS